MGHYTNSGFILKVLLISALAASLNSCGGGSSSSASSSSTTPATAGADPFWNAFNTPTPSAVPAVTTELANPFASTN